MSEPFKGIIKLDVRDSKPDWTPYTLQARARGRAEHPGRAVRRHRPGGVVAVRRPHQHADAAEARRQRADLLAVAHDGAVLADPLDVPDRAQPPREPLRLDHGRARTDSPAPPAACPPSARRSDRSSRTTATAPSGSARTTTCPWRTWPSGGSRSEWPLQKGFDRFYGFLGGETNHWYPDLVEDNQFIDQPYAPEDGYHLSKDLADQALRMLRDQQSAEPVQAVVHVVLPRRQPRAAPRAARVHRQVQRQVRRRLRGVPRVGAAADDRARASCRRARS